MLTLCNPIECSLQASPFMAFSREEYWSGLPFPSPGDLPDLGIEPRSPALQTDAYHLSHQGIPYLYLYIDILCYIHIINIVVDDAFKSPSVTS